MTAPSQAVVDAIENGTTSITRRVEMYESDGTTLWLPGGDDTPRLIDGNVSIDYGRDERRALDVVLDNTDRALRPDPEGGLWYDKVIKTFRGVRYPTDPRPPRIVIVEEDSAGDAWVYRALLYELGFTRTDVKINAANFSEVSEYDIVASFMGEGMVTKHALLKTAFDNGRRIITQGSGNTATALPSIYAATADSLAYAFAVSPTVEDTVLKGGWSYQIQATEPGVRPLSLSAGAIAVARRGEGFSDPTAVIRESSTGSRWFHYQPPVFLSQGKALLANALAWLRDYQTFREWETQVGEFCIDNIAEANHPRQTKISGRDYTKRCLTSKIERDMSFEHGTPISLLIRSLAANAGITKFKIPTTTETLGSTMSFDRGTERWNIMKQAANSNNYELFMDQFGFLTMRKFNDPALSPLAHVFQTGAAGNLVSWDRSVNDSRLYNHIIVTGEVTSEDGGLPFFGEAKNTEPSSPTRIERIGDRSYFYTSSFFTSDQQCIDMALRLLKEKALESYEINWQSFNYPWLDAGEIVDFLDPERLDHEPTRFLMDTLAIPLGLGPMSATGKRVTYVNDTTLESVA